MVKRDTSFTLFLWRIAGILLGLYMLVLLLSLLWSWSSSTWLEKAGLLFFIIWGVPLALSTRRVLHQRRRIERLRLQAQDAPLFPDQPTLDGDQCIVPILLTMKLSRGVYGAFAIFWLAMLGIILLFQVPFFQALHILWWFIPGWLLLGALVIGLASLVCYQRVEATAEALSVQQGLLRKWIPWQEARLFAVINLDGSTSMPVNRYELSSARTILRWTHAAVGSGLVLLPGDRQEYRKLLEELRTCIRARTGLMLRDLR